MRTGKWAISVEEYSNSVYSPYCSGSAFILTGDLPELMYEKSKYLKFFWIDDFYITGLLVNAVDAKLIATNSLYVIKKELVESTFSASYSLFGHMPNDINMMYKLWKLTLKRHIHKNLYSKSNKFSYIDDFAWPKDFWEPHQVDRLSSKEK